MNKAYMEHLKKPGPLILPFPELNQEMDRLGSPKERLMTILTRDLEIKKWFTDRISDIMHYRNRTSNKMSEFYDNILDSRNNLKKSHSVKQQDKYEVKLDMYHQEYNIETICSEVNLTS